MRIRIIALLLLSSLISLASQDSYKIKVKLKNNKDKKAFLANYYNGKVFSVDTAIINSMGEAVFSKEKTLHAGLYLIYLPSKKYFDILIGKDQTFTLETDLKSPVKSMIIEGAAETEAFNKYQLFLSKKNKEKKAAFKKFEKNKEALSKTLSSIDDDVRNYINNISLKYPMSSVASFTKFTLAPKIPDYNKILNKNIKNRKDSINTLSYYYNKNHYWDNTNFVDSTLLRTPIFKSKLDTYFNRILIPKADTIYNESVKLIESSKDNKAMFRYITSYCFNHTLNSKIMGMDEAFFKIAKRYYLSGRAYWVSDSTRTKIREELIMIKYNLIGNKARDLKMLDIDGNWTSLYDIDAPLTLMVFWEPDCGHCKKEMPQLKKEILDKYSDRGLKIFAIYTQDNKEKWEKFVEDNDLYEFINCYDPKNSSNFGLFYNIKTTPMTYLLDKDKTIIAKKLDIKTLGEIIKQNLNSH